MNNVHSLLAYRTAIGWSFDNPDEGFKPEALGEDMASVIEAMLAHSGKPTADRVRFRISGQPAPGLPYEASRLDGDGDRISYRFEVAHLTGKVVSLCPALLKILGNAPAALYIDVQA